MLSRSITGILLVTAMCISLVKCQWGGDQLVVQEDDCGGCFELPDDIKAYCADNNPDYTHTYLPNAKGHKTIKAAYNEFKDFADAINNHCSDHLGVLLCSYYFPQSTCNNPNKPLVSVNACSRICEAAHDSRCTALFNNSPIGGWVEHFSNCSTIGSTIGREQCRRDINIFDICIDHNVIPTNNRAFSPSPKPTTTTEAPCKEGSSLCTTTEPPSEETTAKPTPSEKTTTLPPKTRPTVPTSPKETTTTEVPTTLPPKTRPTMPTTPKETTTTVVRPTTEPPLKQCPRRGCSRPRSSVSGKTYKQPSNLYTFAITGRVLEKVGRSSYKVDVTKDFRLKSCGDDVPQTPIPSEITISMPYEHCYRSTFQTLDDYIGQELLISGIHSNSTGTVTYELGCDKSNTLYAPRASIRHNDNKVSGFVCDGNNVRHINCPTTIKRGCDL